MGEEKNMLENAPAPIQELAKKYPPGRYRITKDAPYSISCPGTEVTLHSYTNQLFIEVIVMAEDKLPAAIAHEKKLMKEHNRNPDEIIAAHKSNMVVTVEPKHLELIEETKAGHAGPPSDG